MSSVKIKWLGNDAELPGIGIAKKGSVLYCNEKDAKSYVKQRLAEYFKDKKVKDGE